MNRFPLRLLLSTLILIAPAVTASAQIISPSQPDVWPAGRGVAVTVHPANSDIAIVASEAGGLFKTTNAGANWTHLNGLPPFRMSDVKYNTVSSQLLIATAKLDGRITRGGIWRSTNAGVNWAKPATAEPAATAGCTPPVNAHGISFEPGSDNVYVGTDCGLAISRDRGATWTHTRLAATGANPRILAVNAQAGGIVAACGDAGFFRSTTSGNMWGQAATGIPPCTQGAPHLIAVSPLEPNVIFVTTSPNTLFESDDGGVTWTSLNPPQPTLGPGTGRPAFVKTHLSADGDPTHLDIYFANAYNAVRQTCTSGGAGLRCSTSWNSITIGPNETPHDPNDITWGATGNSPRYFLSDSGFYVTADGGATFTVIGGGRAGYNALQLYDIAGQIFSDHTDLYFGTQDNCLWASSNRANSWGNARCEEGFNLQMKRRPTSHAQETIVGNIPGRGNFFTVPHFANFNLWNNPPSGTGNPFVVDTGVYLQYTSIPNSSASGLSLTNNTGTNWNSVTQPNSTTRLTIQNSLAHWPQVSGTVSSPVVYQAITKSGTTGNGYPRFGLVRMDLNIAARSGTVTPADVNGLGSLGVYSMGDGTFVSPVVWSVDPNDANHLMAPDVADGQIKVSRDGGATWTPDAALTALVTDSGQIPFSLLPGGNTPPGVGLQVHAIAFDPDTPGRILVGTESAGIFQSIDNGQTWTKISFSDHFIRGMTSFFFADAGTVFVSTYGHGLWRIDPGSFPPPTLCSNPPQDCRIDLRDLTGELILPSKYFCPRPPEIPDCQVVGVDRGIIEDLELDNKGLIKRGAISGEGLLAYNWDSKQIPLDIGGIEFSKSTSPGAFEGCAVCNDVLKEGGTIKGIVQDKGTVLAIIAEFSKQSTSRSQPVTKPIQTSATTSAYLQLVGTIPVTGQAVAAAGDTVNVYGSGFCGSSNCSRITLRIGNRVVGDNVRPDDKGNFRASFTVREMHGQYLVTASQLSATKAKIEDSKLLIVPIVDKEGRE